MSGGLTLTIWSWIPADNSNAILTFLSFSPYTVSVY